MRHVAQNVLIDIVAFRSLPLRRLAVTGGLATMIHGEHSGIDPNKWWTALDRFKEAKVSVTTLYLHMHFLGCACCKLSVERMQCTDEPLHSWKSRKSNGIWNSAVDCKQADRARLEGS
jgi:hypothetical protein